MSKRKKLREIERLRERFSESILFHKERKKLEVMNGGVKSKMSVSCSVEQRLNLLRKKKYLSRANGNHQKCWSPVLQSIPEDKLLTCVCLVHSG